jgi:hypothetical protein
LGQLGDKNAQTGPKEAHGNAGCKVSTTANKDEGWHVDIKPQMLFLG